MTSMGSANANTIPWTKRTVSAFIPTVPGTNMGTTKNTALLSSGSAVVIPTTGVTWPRTR